MNDPKRDDDYYIFWSSTPKQDLFNKDELETHSRPTPKRAEGYKRVEVSPDVVDVPTNSTELALEADLRALYAKYNIDPNQPDSLNAEAQQIRAAIRRLKRDYHDSKHYKQNHLKIQMLKTGLQDLSKLVRRSSVNATQTKLPSSLWQVLALLVILIGAGVFYVSSTDHTSQPQAQPQLLNPEAPAK